MFKLSFLVIGAFALFSEAPAAQIVSLPDGINKAGRQRMLSQRCSKAYIALALGQERQRAQGILDDCVAAFSRSQLELRGFAPTPEIKDAVAKVDEQWNSFTALAIGKVADKSNVGELLAIDAKLLAAADRVTVLLQTQSGVAAAKIVNMSGRQRMLAQRMAKFQLATMVKNETAYASEIQATRKEYVAAKSELLAAPQTTPTIKNQLELAIMQWDFFENNLSKKDAGATYVRDVLASSENVSGVFDNLTKLYAGSP